MQLAAVALLLAVLLGSALLRRALGLEIDPDGLRERVEALGAFGPALLVGAIAVRPLLLIPSAVLLTVGGACFGAALGTLYGAAGLTAYGLLQWLFVQWAGAEALRARVPPNLHGALRMARSRLGIGALALVAAHPIGPVTAVQLAAALAGMGPGRFVLAVGAGSLLRAALFSYFGSALLEGEGVLLAGALVALAVALPFVPARSRRWLLRNLE
jgi:uncharacterized membrane protein YdjX (TVP38/TMEM64 family)